MLDCVIVYIYIYIYIYIYMHTILIIWVGRLVWRLATDWTVRGSNPGGSQIFRTCPYRPWDPPSLLYNGYRVFPGGKERPRSDADPSPLSSAVGHERVELYLYSPSGLYGLYRDSVPVQGWSLPLLFTSPTLFPRRLPGKKYNLCNFF